MGWLFSSQSHGKYIKQGKHDACNDDRTKIAALFYRVNESRGVFRLDHRARKHFLPEPSQNRAPERRPSQRHDTESGEVHPDDAGGNGNQMSYHWQKPRKKNASRFVPVNPSFSALQLVLA